MKRVIGRLNPQDRRVTIWGAGFSGLVMGYYLKSNGYKVTIYERSERAGGKIHTKRTPLGPAETAANALYLNADGLELVRELKLEPLLATKKLRRYIYINGKPRSPLKLSVLTKLMMNARIKPPRITEGLTVAEFFRPLLGDHIINNYLSPALGGVYSAPSETLHFRSLFHEVGNQAQFDSYWSFMKTIMKIKKAQPKGDVTGSISFEGGMQALINALVQEMKADIKLNYKEHFRIKGNTIVCTDAFNAAELTQEVRPEFSAELRRIKYQELSTSTVFMKREVKPLHKAFGVLIPLQSGFNSIGILNNKAIFPANNSNVYAYTFIARKQILEEEIYQDLNRLQSSLIPDDVEQIESTYWDKAIPLYDLQRYLSVKRMHQLGRSETNFAIFGNYMAGISLREMITAAKTFAKQPVDYPEF